MNIVFMIFTKHNTQFGPYANKEFAQEAKEQLVCFGDSLDIKWRRSELKITECREWTDNKGMVTFEPVN